MAQLSRQRMIPKHFERPSLSLAGGRVLAWSGRKPLTVVVVDGNGHGCATGR